MARGCEMAVALRARGGRNMMLQTRGIATNDIKEASKQVVANLARFSSSTGKAESDGSGDQLISATHGHMTVNNGRHNVVYRLVNSVYVIGIAAPSTALFSLVRLVDGATKQLVVACRGTDVTVDKVAKNYAAVYAGTSAALDTLGTSPTQAAVVSAGMLTLMFPEESKKDKKHKKKADQAADAAATIAKPHRKVGGQRRSLVDGPKLGDATVDKLAGISPSPARSSISKTPKSSPKGSRIGTPDWRGAPTSSRPSQNGDSDWDQLAVFPPPALVADHTSSFPAGVAIDQDSDERSFETTLRNNTLLDGAPFHEGAELSSSAPGSGMAWPQSGHPSFTSEATGFTDFSSSALGPARQDGFPTALDSGAAADGFADLEPNDTVMSPEALFDHVDPPVHQASGFADFGWDEAAGATTSLPMDDAKAADFSDLPTSSVGDLDNSVFTIPREATNVAAALFPQPDIASQAPTAGSAILGLTGPVQRLAMLQLFEVWAAEFQGDVLVSASIGGEVQMTSGTVAQTFPAFAIQAELGNSNPIYPLLQKSLLAADLKDGAGCRDSKPGCYHAEFDFGDELEQSQALLRYQLPPSTVLPPMVMKVSVGASAGSMPGGPGLVSVQYAVSPMLPGPLQDVIVQVKLGSKNRIPVKADPSIEWCVGCQTVQWHIGSLAPEATGALYLQVESRTSPGDAVSWDASIYGLISHASAKFTYTSGSFSGATCVPVESPCNTLEGQLLPPPSTVAVGLITARPSITTPLA